MILRSGGVLLLFGFALGLAPAFAVAQPPRVVHEINVTSDSEVGWTPSVEQESAARKAVSDFLAALDAGRAADAYSRLSEMNRGEQPAEFAARLAKFNALAGSVRERRIVKVTWTKNPPSGPAPGVYAAVDLVSRFERVDRHCGYLVAYQRPSGGPFEITRIEDTYLDNASAKSIASSQSPAALDAAWRAASAYCPNYPERPPAPAIEDNGPISESKTGSIGYPSIAAALAALHAKPGVVFSDNRGWTIADDTPARTIWSFTPAGYPAHPSAVKREIIEENGVVSLRMSVMCLASKAACDDLVRTFEQMNRSMFR